MHFHALTHVPFEGPANIEVWARTHGHSMSQTALWNREPLPSVDSLDFLVVMGGPMNIYEEKEYPWLKDEKRFIEKCIREGKKVLGICLGAQLIADVLGGKVYRNAQKEIGWFPIELTEAGKRSGLFSGLNTSGVVFHWHGDTFHLPEGAVSLARSGACEQQAFLYDEKVVGLQFHIESTPESVAALIDHCKNELAGGEYVQSEEAIRSNQKHYPEIQKALHQLLDRMTRHENAGRASKVPL